MTTRDLFHEIESYQVIQGLVDGGRREALGFADRTGRADGVALTLVARPRIYPDQAPDKVHSVEIYAATRRQDGKATNEDAFVLGRGEVPYAALCDGSGNAQGVAKRALGIFQRLVGEVGPERMTQFVTWLG